MTGSGYPKIPALTMTLQRFASPLDAGTTRCRFAGGFLLVAVCFCLALETSNGPLDSVVLVPAINGSEEGCEEDRCISTQYSSSPTPWHLCLHSHVICTKRSISK